ncbi:MAG: hypothetical protein J0L60_06560 [Ignavibacteria bacterium]|nr:hypothetical protein [Ignavibacteria bacterium]
MSKIDEALREKTASLLEIQELSKRIDSLESAVRDLTKILKDDLKETKDRQTQLEDKVEKLERFKNMLIGALILSNIIVGIIVKFFL